MLESKIRDVFASKYGKAPECIVKAPGRINIMGEHTDYNLGYVLPAAIDHYMYIGFAKNNDLTFNVYSIDYDKEASLTYDDIQRSEVSWLNLINGIIDQFKDRIGGFDMVFCGSIPEGAGLSSSAALCCGTAFGLAHLFGQSLDKWAISKIAQQSEHRFAQVQCGIMDQFACMFGQANHVLILDCLDLTYEKSQIDMSGYTFVLLDSNVKHELNESDYNARREESADALERLKRQDEAIKTLRDVSLSRMESQKSDEVWWKRAYHIVTENQRVLAINAALKNHEFDVVGALLNEGHYSQKNYYQITCEETDFLADELNKETIVLGARQVGGGFGGCILSIVKDVDIDPMLERLNASYTQAFGKTTHKIPIRISRGCHII